jgi:hypothetical protein
LKRRKGVFTVQRQLFTLAAVVCPLFIAAQAAVAQPVASLVLPDNMAVLKASMPTPEYHFLGSNAPSQVFLTDEPVNVKASFAKGGDNGAVDFVLEIQEITTRDPSAKAKGGYTDTGGDAPRIGLEGKPIQHPFKVMFDDKKETVVEIANIPVPAKFGTYALVLVRGDKRQFLGSVTRVIAPSATATLENTPIFGEFAFFDNAERYNDRAAAYERIGIKGLRLETSWNESQDGKMNWENADKIFAAVEAHHIRLMVTLGGHNGWMWPFKTQQTPAAVRPDWDSNPYSGQSDWVTGPENYERYGKWITEFCQRYWKDGKGALWGLENYNEPWEGGGISGWARDAIQYRAIQKLIAESAWKVSRDIKICAASSIMNTEDKFFADGSRDMDKYIDVFTDHYVVPPMCYGPLVAAAHGKVSCETESWFVNSEYLLPQIVQFLASGQQRLSPWHPRVLFEGVPGNDNQYLIPSPVVAASAAFNHFVSGKPFEKLVFMDHLPWVFQFGKDADKDGLLVVLGQLMTIGGESPRDRLWAQVEASNGGTLTIDNADGLLKFYDLAGNPTHVGEKSVALPLSIYPTYITSDKGPAAAAARIKSAKMEGKRPVEIIPHDFITRVDAKGAALKVTVHNCLNRAITGKLTVAPPAGLSLQTSEMPVELAAGESTTMKFPISAAKVDPVNAYPFKFTVTSDGGNAEYAETMHATIAVKGKKTIDGNLDDWKDVPGVTVAASTQKVDLSEMARRPWLNLKDEHPDGNFMEFKVAWDEDNLYLAARVNDKTAQMDSPPMAGRNEDRYFHSAADDQVAPFKDWLAKNAPGRSFAEVPYVYRDSPEKPMQPDLPVIPYRRDRIQIALDVTPDWHDLKPDTDKVPAGFHAVPDTDYEYAIYPTKGGSAETWRLLAPGVPRRGDFPHTGHGKLSTGAVEGAKQVVKREGNTYIYEVSLPRSELAKFDLKPGTIFGLMFRAGNNEGPHVDFGNDKAVCKNNGLTLHPYWERCSNCGVRWALVE